MKKNLLIALFAAASIAPVAASAQGYLGATGGVAHLKATTEGEAGALKDHDTSFKFFGGYQFTKMFGIEGGYVIMNKLRTDADPTLTVAPNSTYLAGTVAYPIGANFAVTGKVGIASTRTKVMSSQATRDFRNNTPVLGVGMTYDLTPSVKFVAEYENFGKVVDQDGAVLKANNLGVGIRVSF